MKYNFVTNPNNITKEAWNSFLDKHPNGNIFQTPEYYNSLISQLSAEPPSIFLLNENNEIIGLMIGEYLFENKVYKNLTKRTRFVGAPLVENNSPELLKIILTEYKRLFDSKNIYSEFRQIGSADLFSDFNYDKLIEEKRLNIIVNLNKTENELFNLMDSSRRRQIQRGYRRGLQLIIYECGNDQIIKECYTILKHLYNKIKLPVPPLSFFLSAGAQLKQYMKIFTVNYEKELVGFRFVLCYKDLIFDWYAASKEEHYDKYPNDILPWEVIKWGSLNKYRYFDFGGAGKPNENYGVRDYKLKFGGDLISTSRYKIIHKPMIMSIATTAFHLLRDFSKGK